MDERTERLIRKIAKQLAEREVLAKDVPTVCPNCGADLVGKDGNWESITVKTLQTFYTGANVNEAGALEIDNDTEQYDDTEIVDIYCDACDQSFTEEDFNGIEWE